MTKILGFPLATLILVLTTALLIAACGQDPIPEPTVASQPAQAAPSPQPTTPAIAAETPATTPAPSPSPTSYVRTPIQRPTGFTPRSPDPTPIPDPPPSPTPTTTAIATPTPISPTQAPTITATAQPTPAESLPDDDLNVITLLPKDAIPAILDPTFINATEAWDQYQPDELILGVSINDEHKAYSVPYLSNREIVNDELGGVAIAATW